ncbi:formyltransferase family protein [Verrucomicrobia bacterium]|nr:formyltransferase family protein [Verrucomicrobiota bacterium]
MKTSQNSSICFGEIDRYILFGAGKLLVYVAKKLNQLGHKVLVVTSKRQSNENTKIGSKTISFAEFLEHEKIEYVVVKQLLSNCRVVNFINQNTLGLSFGAAWIFKREFIEKFGGKLLNFHGSRLPQDRGGGGFSWRILKGERIGVSLIHQIDEGVDTGRIVFSREYVYPVHCRLPIEYEVYTIEKYKLAFDNFFIKLSNIDSFTLIQQQEIFSSYWPRLSANVHGYINWGWDLADIEKFICAFDDPYPGALTYLGENLVRIKDCYSWKGEGNFHPFQKGIIYRKRGGNLFIAAEHGVLIVGKLLDKKGYNIIDNVNVGDRLHTPTNLTDKAMECRAVYSPDGLKLSKS